VKSGQVIQDWRRNVNEPGTNRFTVADSIDLLNKAQVQTALDLPYTEGTDTFPTIANQQEYAMVENIRVLRVYMLGPNGSKQLIEPTDIPTMEGENANIFDASSDFIQGQPPLTPQWIAQKPVTYPYRSPQRQGQGHPASMWNWSNPPRWYRRYGNIGFVPPPNAVFTVCMDFIPIPPTVVTTSDLLAFPEMYRDALVYKMSEYSRQADGSADSMKNAQLYMAQIKKLQTNVNKFQATKSLNFVPWIRRSRGNNSCGWGGGWWF
jgi:hypothetical protein